MWGRRLNLMWQMSQKIHHSEDIAKYSGSPLICLLLFIFPRTLKQECLYVVIPGKERLVNDCHVLLGHPRLPIVSS